MQESQEAFDREVENAGSKTSRNLATGLIVLIFVFLLGLSVWGIVSLISQDSSISSVSVDGLDDRKYTPEAYYYIGLHQGCIGTLLVVDQREREEQEPFCTELTIQGMALEIMRKDYPELFEE